MSFDIGQLLILVLFVLLPLLSFVMRRITTHPEPPVPEDESGGQSRRRGEPAPRSRPLPRPPRSSEHETAPPAVLTIVSRRRPSRRGILKSRRDARRGIVLMTLLGPCRAYDPPG